MASPAATSAPAPAKKRILGVVFLTLFLDLVGFSIIFPLFPAMLDYYLPNGAGDGSLLGQFVGQLTHWAARSGAEDPRLMATVLFGGVLGSLYSILQFIFAPIWGRLSDRVGRRPVLLMTIGGLALSYALWFFAASFWLLILSRVVGGVMGGNLSVATAAVADSTSRENRSRGLALIGVAFGLGFIVGPAVGGVSALVDLTAHFPALAAWGVNPFSIPALISLLLTLINLTWVYRRFEETLTEANRATTKPKGSGFAVFRLLSSGGPNVRRTNLLYLIFMLAFSGMEFTLTFLAVERFAFSPAQNGGMFVFIGFILIVAQGGLVRRLAGPVGEKRLALAGLLSGLAAFIALAFATQIGLFFAALALLGLSIGLVSPTLSALVSLYSSESEQGAHLGIYRSAGSLARAIGPLVAAFVYFAYGSQSAYLLGAMIVILPFVLALKLPQPKKVDG